MFKKKVIFDLKKMWRAGEKREEEEEEKGKEP